MLEYKVKLNDSVFIRWQGTSLDINLFPQVKIYNIEAPTVVVDTLDLPHLNSGLYGLKWKPRTAGKYFTQTIIYSTDYGVDESGVDRPDSDSINVESSSGAGGYLLGVSGQQQYKKEDLSESDIEKISESIYKKILPVIKESELNISELIKNIKVIDYSYELKHIIEKISDIKFDYNFDDTYILEAIDIIANKIDVSNKLLISYIQNIPQKDIKIEKKITQLISEDTTDNDDLEIAKDILKNPNKRFSYAKEKKLNSNVINYLLCLKGSC